VPILHINEYDREWHSDEWIDNSRQAMVANRLPVELGDLQLHGEWRRRQPRRHGYQNPDDQLSFAHSNCHVNQYGGE
jgi:hypothetical protein